MNNIKIKKNKDVYLKVKSKRVKQKFYKANPILVKGNIKEKEIEIPTIQEFLDIALSCDNMFQYIYEKKFLNKRYYYTLAILTFVTLIVNYLSGYVLFGLFRMPDKAYRYECFSLNNFVYQNCTYRDVCDGQEEPRVNVCYDSRSNCRETFISSYKKSKINWLNLNSNSNHINVRFIIDYSEITLFNRVDSDYCQTKNYSILLVIFLFLGGSLGLFTSGILADYFGKRIVIIWVGISLILENAVIIGVSRYSVSDFPSITQFFTIWSFISFFSGLSLYALEYLVFLNFMEFYPDSKSLKNINAYFHSQFAITNMSFVLLNTYLKNLFIFHYVSLCFFGVFVTLFYFYFVENPRFYSERRDYEMKMKSFMKVIQKVLVKKGEINENIKNEGKEDLGKHEVYWRELVITNVTRNKALEQPQSENPSPNINELLLLKSRTERANLIKANNQLANDKEWNTVRTSMLNQKKSRMFVDEIKNQSKINNINNRREIVLNEHNELFNDKFGIEDLENLMKSKKRNVLNLFKIYRKFFKDKFVKKYFLIFLLLWVSIIYCFYGSTFSVLFILSNPNKANLIQNYGVVIYSFLVLMLMPYIIGNLSGLIPLDNKFFLMITFLIYTSITIFLDSYNLIPSSDRIYYFGSPNDYAKHQISPISTATSSSLIITSVSLFNLLLITSVPTAYRTIFVSSLKSFGNLIPIFAFLSFYLLDTPFLIMGMISLCGFMIFFSFQFKWRDVKMVESVDNEDLYMKINTKNHNKAKKSISLKNFRTYSETNKPTTRLSIFNRVKLHSL